MDRFAIRANHNWLGQCLWLRAAVASLLVCGVGVALLGCSASPGAGDLGQQLRSTVPAQGVNALCTPGPPIECPAQPTPSPPRAGLLAFNLSGLHNTSDIYRIGADGSDPVRLIEDTDPNAPPAWSPDGLKIAFLSSRDGAQSLYMADWDGTQIQRLTEDLLPIEGLSWSPDGQRIAFAAQGADADSDSDIWVIDLRTLRTTNLTMAPGWDIQPAWSPDGTRIAFASGRTGKPEVFSMNADGSQVRPLTDDPMGCSRPAWSPDGRRIAYDCLNQYAGIIVVASADGSDPKPLMKREDRDGASNPSWSPDGRSIAFDSVRTGADEIYVMYADGSGIVQLTDYGPLGISSSRPAYRPAR
jgi:TolB protein